MITNHTLTLSPPLVRTQYTEKQSEAQHEEEQLVHSDLWKTIFRGGYMVSKFMRSLSGAFVSVSSCLLAVSVSSGCYCM